MPLLPASSSSLVPILPGNLPQPAPRLKLFSSSGPCRAHARPRLLLKSSKSCLASHSLSPPQAAHQQGLPMSLPKHIPSLFTVPFLLSLSPLTWTATTFSLSPCLSAPPVTRPCNQLSISTKRNVKCNLSIWLSLLRPSSGFLVH